MEKGFHHMNYLKTRYKLIDISMINKKLPSYSFIFSKKGEQCENFMSFVLYKKNGKFYIQENYSIEDTKEYRYFNKYQLNYKFKKFLNKINLLNYKLCIYNGKNFRR